MTLNLFCSNGLLPLEIIRKPLETPIFGSIERDQCHKMHVLNGFNLICICFYV